LKRVAYQNQNQRDWTSGELERLRKPYNARERASRQKRGGERDFGVNPGKDRNIFGEGGGKQGTATARVGNGTGRNLKQDRWGFAYEEWQDGGAGV